jgi:hypothetical protein
LTHASSGVIFDVQNNLVGTAPSSESCDPKACGVLFRIAASGSQTVLYTFCSQSNCSDGGQPVASPAIDSAGVLYGSTAIGGAHAQGTLYKFGQSYEVMYDFCAKTNCVDFAKCRQPFARNS